MMKMKKLLLCTLSLLVLNACASAPEAQKSAALQTKPAVVAKKTAKAKPAVKKTPEKEKTKAPSFNAQIATAQYDALTAKINASKSNDSLFASMDCAGYLDKEVALDGVTSGKKIKLNKLMAYAYAGAQAKDKTTRVKCTSNDDADVIFETNANGKAADGIGFYNTQDKDVMKISGFVKNGRYTSCERVSCTAKFLKTFAD